MNLKNLILTMLGQEIGQIHTTLPGRIEKYYPETMRADVVLYNKKKIDNKWEEIPPILNMPVKFPKVAGFYMRMPLKKKDPVVICFAEESIDNLVVDGQSHNSEDSRRFSMDDGFIMGGFSLENDKLKKIGEHTEDVMLVNNVTGTVIRQNQAGEIFIEDSKNITIDNSDNITIKSGNIVSMECDLLNIKCNSMMKVTTPIFELNGNQLIKGDQSITGAQEITDISESADHISGGKSGKAHTHMEQGDGKPTGPPQ